MKIMYLTPVISMALMLVVLFFLSDTPHSFDAYISPYTGEFTTISTVMLVIAVLDFFLINLFYVPRFISDPKGHLAILTMPAAFACFGFIVGVINYNFWASLPYFAVSFGNYQVLYNKISEKSKSV